MINMIKKLTVEDFEGITDFDMFWQKKEKIEIENLPRTKLIRKKARTEVNTKNLQKRFFFI